VSLRKSRIVAVGEVAEENFEENPEIDEKVVDRSGEM
jgi:hypothetical protein